jgi:hypothetical protein
LRPLHISFRYEGKQHRKRGKRLAREGNTKVDLEREVFFLKEHRKEVPGEFELQSPGMAGNSWGYQQDMIDSDADSIVTSPNPSNASPIIHLPSEVEEALDHLPPPPPRRHNRYGTYFQDEYEHRVVQRKELQFHDTIQNNQYAEIVQAIGDLRAEKDALVHSFGVQKIEDVPGLHVPKPYNVRVDLTALAQKAKERQDKEKGKKSQTENRR